MFGSKENIGDLSREMSQVLSGHGLINFYLCKRDLAKKSMCPTCKKSPVTVQHLLQECPTWLAAAQDFTEKMDELGLENIVAQISGSQEKKYCKKNGRVRVGPTYALGVVRGD
ncbi:hypothetical protein RUM43_005265 [Polyplax serrata]|uniref:Reverse transcriptase n=1 Tax=Polyplax serrata TaxID=468196 RepID=A0AAN8PDC2_POLSC